MVERSKASVFLDRGWGRGFASRLSLFFFRRDNPSARQLETKTFSRMNDVDRENAKNAGAGAGAATKEMDEPAGERGMATRNEKEGSS